MALTSSDETKLDRLKRRRAHSGKMWHVVNAGLLYPEWDRISEWELMRLRNVPWDEVIAYCGAEVCDRPRRHKGAHSLAETRDWYNRNRSKEG